MSTIERKTSGQAAYYGPGQGEEAQTVAGPLAGSPTGTASLPTAKLNVIPNPLYKYSSYMYNFTLAAVRKSDANNSASYMEKDLDLVILKTGGKGTGGFALPNSDSVTEAEKNYQKESTDRAATVDSLNRKKAELDAAKKAFNQASGTIPTFNQRSPGRFDMFIDNIEIDTIMGPNEASGATTATAIKFDVIEPYSINGFIEALHFSALAAGYLNYAQASYVLKLEFKGYPSGVSTPSPEVVPDSTRYFLLGFAGLDVEVTEKGTRYRCKAVPFNEKVFGITNTIKTPISMSGDTVKEILNDLCNNLNLQMESRDKSAKSEKPNKSDKYFIKFPSRKGDGTLDYDKDNEIAKVNLLKIENNNKLYKFTNPGDKNKSVKNAYQIVKERVQGKENVETSQMQVQYRENARIHEIIESVIRDSEYLRTKLKNMKGSIDAYGYFDFFIIKTEVENQKETDPVSRKPFQNFTYVVLPYKIHYTRIPPYSSQTFNPNLFKNIILKDYNYIYTGKNNDIINFKINFNSLFFEAIPAAMANTDQPDARFSNSKNDKNALEIKNESTGAIAGVIVGTPMLRASDIPTSIQQRGGNAGQPSIDPYQAVARNMHNAIINSNASMVGGEIEIIGDPFYLIQGGMGNFNPEISKKSDRMNKAGDANHLLGEVLIQIKFKNPVGIQSLDVGGLAAFELDDSPFAGIYRVNKVKNIFSDGTFKQQLNIIRLMGQTTDSAEELRFTERLATRVVDSGSVAPGDTSLAVFDQQDAEEGAAITEAQRTAAIAAVLEAQDAEFGAAMAAAEAAQQVANSNAAAGVGNPGEEAAREARRAAAFAEAIKKTEEALLTVRTKVAESQQRLAELKRLQALGNFTPVVIDGDPVNPANIEGYWIRRTEETLAANSNKLQGLEANLRENQPLVPILGDDGNFIGAFLPPPPPPPPPPVPNSDTGLVSQQSTSNPVLPENVMKSIDPLPLYGDEALGEIFKSPQEQQARESAAAFNQRTAKAYQDLQRILGINKPYTSPSETPGDPPTTIIVAGPRTVLPPLPSGETRELRGARIIRLSAQGTPIEVVIYRSDAEALRALEASRRIK